MSSVQGTARPTGFKSRLNRVEAKRAPIDAAKPDVELLPDWKANLRQPMMLSAAVIFGMVAVFLVRLARFHLMGSLPAMEIPDVTMLIDGGIAMICLFLVFRLLKGTPRKIKAAHALGVVAMVGLMHNFVHSAPGVFGLLFSKEWTAVTVAYSEPDSIYVGSKYVVFLPPDDGKAAEQEIQALPKVRRSGVIANGD
ncbi:MAG: hypothetical protein ACR2O1_15630 [Boseongicola sp.]